MQMGGFTVLFSFQFPPLREGRQPVVRHALDGFPISIPAPARGATRPTTAIRTVITISIPAPARGATRWIPPPQPISRFQFPPLREGRPTDGMSDSSQALFQFPPLREGRQRFSHDFREISNFNSRPCARGDMDLYVQRRDYDISIPAPARGATKRADQRGEW